MYYRALLYLEYAFHVRTRIQEICFEKNPTDEEMQINSPVLSVVHEKHVDVLRARHQELQEAVRHLSRGAAVGSYAFAPSLGQTPTLVDTGSREGGSM